MHITITGKTGSGKTTISKLIRDEMGYERYSTGEYQREIAQKMGVDMIKMNEIMRDNISYDHLIDKTVEQISRERSEDKLIFDSRMAWHFAADSFRIFISIDPAVAGERVFRSPRAEEPYASADEAARKLTERSNAENLRFRTIYGVDNFDYSNYDLIIDSSHFELSEYIPIIKDSLDAFTADREGYRRRIYIAPGALLPKNGFNNCVCGRNGCNCDILIVPYADKHYVVRGHARVAAAIEAGERYVISDIPKKY